MRGRAIACIAIRSRRTQAEGEDERTKGRSDLTYHWIEAGEHAIALKVDLTISTTVISKQAVANRAETSQDAVDRCCDAKERKERSLGLTGRRLGQETNDTEYALDSYCG